MRVLRPDVAVLITRVIEGLARCPVLYAPILPLKQPEWKCASLQVPHFLAHAHVGPDVLCFMHPSPMKTLLDMSLLEKLTPLGGSRRAVRHALAPLFMLPHEMCQRKVVS